MTNYIVLVTAPCVRLSLLNNPRENLADAFKSKTDVLVRVGVGEPQVGLSEGSCVLLVKRGSFEVA
ncbi:MAG: hypothetical protein M3317_01470 [Actinomycetota bacterium]|nr:hypothetical protein [Actinomycetota bacterium]